MDEILHLIKDYFYVWQWLLDELKDLMAVVFAPLSWIFNFSKGFLFGAGSPPQEITHYVFTAQIIGIFQDFPYFNSLLTAIACGLGILVVAFIFRKIIHI